MKKLSKVGLAVSAVCSMAVAGQAGAQETGMFEEIVVTARKFEENVQTVPVAISAIGASTIEKLGLQDLADISKITAGLIFDDEFSRVGNRPVIRGQANILGGSGVSYFIDGVYITGSVAAYDLNDIERIEVVKGPQSALYGRNTYSGAINMITKSPGDALSGNLSVEAVTDDQYEVSGTLRGPLVADTLGASLTARYYEAGGAFTNTFDGSDIGEQESTSVSGVLHFTPVDMLDIRLRAYYAELRDGQPPIFGTSASENNCYFDNGALYGGDGRYYCGVLKSRPINSDWTVQAPDAQQTNDDLQTSLNIRVDINDNWSLASITGYNDSDETFIVEADYQPTAFQTAVFARFPIAGAPPNFTFGYAGAMVDFTFASQTATDDWSQELRLEYAGERFNAIIGAYYFDQTVESRSIRELPPGAAATGTANFLARLAQQQQICTFNPVCANIVPLFGPGIVVPRDINTLDITNQAIFGLVSYKLTDTVRLTAEARYQEEEIEQEAVSQNLDTPPANVEVTLSDATFDSFSPRVTIDWQWSEASMLYALYAEGTKPGGFNSVTAIEAGLPTFEEEEVKSIEFGVKNVLFDGQLIANIAMYFNRISGYQLTQNARSGGNTTSATVNAGDAEVTGFELETSYRPASVAGLTLTFNYAYADPKFTKGVDENQGVLNDVLDDNLVNCSTGDQFPGAPCQSLFGSIVGKQIPRTAEHQAYLDLEMRRPMGAGNWEWFAGANYSYESSKYAQVHNLAETGETTLVNARLGVTSDTYSIALWGKNLTGEDSVPNVLRYADGADDFKRSFAASQRRDTYYGLTVTAKF